MIKVAHGAGGIDLLGDVVTALGLAAKATFIFRGNFFRCYCNFHRYVFVFRHAETMIVGDGGILPNFGLRRSYFYPIGV